MHLSLEYRRFLPFILVVLFFLTGTKLPAMDHQTRALWVTRWDYQTKQDIERIMQNAHTFHFNTIIFQVRGNGTVAYPSQVEPWSNEFDHTDPGWDPLQVALELAHEHGMELHAWINVYPGWSGHTAPGPEDQLYNKHSSWFMMDRWGQPQTLNSHYVWLSPSHPLVQRHILKICRELYTNYNIDGLHLDYIRYPGVGYSFDPISLKLFQLKTGRTPDELPYTWNRFRRNSITQLVSKIHKDLKEHNPDLVLSASVMGDFYRGYQLFFQDSHGWLARNIVDALYPMIYTNDSLLFRNWLTQHISNDHERHIYPGILCNSGAQMRDQVRITREEQCQGVALFGYSTLFPSHFPDPEYTGVLEQIFGPAVTPAPLPWKKFAGDSQGPVISQIKTIPAKPGPDTKFKIAAYITDPSGVYDDKTGAEGQGIYLLFDRQWPPQDGSAIKMSRVKKDKNWYITDDTIPPQQIGLDFRCRIFAWDDYHESAGHPKRNQGYSDVWSFSILQSDEHYISKGRFGPRLWRPSSITITPTNNIWLGCNGESPIIVISPEGRELPMSPIYSAIDEYGNPIEIESITSLACTPSGTIYALDAGNPGLLLRFQAATGKADTAIALGYYGYAVDCDDWGNLFILENQTTRWHVHNKQGTELAGSPFGEGHVGQDIAVLNDGASVFINDLSTNTVKMWHGAVEGDHARFWRADDPPAVDMDLGKIRTNSNYVYISHSLRGVVTIFDRTGKPVAHLSGGKPPLYSPLDIGIADGGNTLYMLEAAGNGPTQLTKWVK